MNGVVIGDACTYTDQAAVLVRLSTAFAASLVTDLGEDCVMTDGRPVRLPLLFAWARRHRRAAPF